MKSLRGNYVCLQEKGNSGKNKKWKLWRNPSGDWKGRHGSESVSYSAAVATVLRAPPKDFKAVRQEWAAIRIQTAFRGFLVSSKLLCLIGKKMFLFNIKFKFH